MKLSEHFDRVEFNCKCGCGQDTVDAELLEVLEDIRNYFKSPVVIKSGNRCMTYNAVIEGAPMSQHIESKAADISVRGVTPRQIHVYLLSKYPDKHGIGIYDSFVHIDVKEGKRRWVG